MTKSEFIAWLQTAKFTLSADIDGHTEVDAYDYTDDQGNEIFKPVCNACAWNTAESTLPDNSTFSVTFQQWLEWTGTSNERYGEYTTSSEGIAEIVWESNRPEALDEDEDYLDENDIDGLVRDYLDGLTDIDYDRLIPAETTTDIDIDEENIMDTITIIRDKESDIRFTGEKIASASTSPDTARSDFSGSTGRWTTLRLYRTKSGKYICEQIGHTQWQGENDRHSGAICETHAEIIAFFGHGWLAKELYEDAEIEDVVDVD